MLAALSYTVCSVTMVLGNKAITSLEDINGMQVGAVFFQNAVAVMLLSPWASAINFAEMLSVAKEVFLLACVFVCMLVSSLTAFQYLGIATVVLMKNCSTMFTILGERFFYGRELTASTMLGFGVMCFANMMYANFDLQYSTVGYLWGGINVFSTSGHALLLQRITKTCKVSKHSLVIFTNLFSLPILAVTMIVRGEPSIIMAKMPSASALFMFVNILVSFTGGMLGYSSLWTVQTLGAGSMAMLGMLNKIPLVLLGSLLLGDKFSWQSASFCALGILGGVIFTGGHMSSADVKRKFVLVAIFVLAGASLTSRSWSLNQARFFGKGSTGMEKGKAGTNLSRSGELPKTTNEFPFQRLSETPKESSLQRCIDSFKKRTLLDWSGKKSFQHKKREPPRTELQSKRHNLPVEAIPGLKQEKTYPIDDYILAYKNGTDSSIDLGREGLPRYTDPLPNWVLSFCPQVVRHFKRFPYFDYSPGDQVPFPTVQTSESAMTTVCLLQAVKIAAQRTNTTWMLAAGSALGATLHGGPIPWDDDSDIYIDIRHHKAFFAEIVQVFSGLQVPLVGTKFKLFHKDSARTRPPKQKHKWPFIDIFLFHTHSGQIVELLGNTSQEKPYKYRLPVAQVFPLREYFFGGIFLPGPKNRTIITKRYDLDRCVLPSGNHRLELWKWKRPTEVDCSRLFKYFPFLDVVSCEGHPEVTFEVLSINSRVVHVSAVDSTEALVTVSSISIAGSASAKTPLSTAVPAIPKTPARLEKERNHGPLAVQS